MSRNTIFCQTSSLRYCSLSNRVLSQPEIAKKVGMTKENVTIIEKRARKNVKLAQDTLQIYRLLISLAEIKIKGTRLIDVPGIVVKFGDNIGVRLNVNFTKIYNEMRIKARNCINQKRW